MTRLLVTGSRDWPEEHYPLLCETLDGLCDWDLEPFFLMEGGARGADRQADRWAWNSPAHPTPNVMGGPFWHLKFNAEWSVHAYGWCPSDWCRSTKRHCLGAGARRNQQMIDAGPTFVVAFKDRFNWKLDKGGTEDAIKRAIDAGIPHKVIDPWGEENERRHAAADRQMTLFTNELLRKDLNLI